MGKQRYWRMLLAAAFLVLVPWAAQAKIDQAKTQRLVANDGAGGDIFGYSLAVSGSTAIIGAWGDDTKGSVYVFIRATDGTWSQQTKLTAADGTYGDAFGVAVALSSDGRTALIGAAGNLSADTMRPGLAYIFTYSGSIWTQQAKLTDPKKTDGDAFGGAVALSSDGNTALIGAATAYIGTAGTAYVFTRSGNNWTQQTRLISSDGGSGDGFGNAVAVSSDGKTALIGASWKGAAYIFTSSNGTWNQQTELITNNAGDKFGASVSLSANGNIALIGADGDDSFKGAAYVFTRSGSSSWTQQAKLTASAPDYDDWFGNSVSLSADGDTAVVGAHWDEAESGAAYIFTRSGVNWMQQTKLISPNATAYDFGYAVSLSADSTMAIVGEREAAYVYVAAHSNITPVYKLLL